MISPCDRDLHNLLPPKLTLVMPPPPTAGHGIKAASLAHLRANICTRTRACVGKWAGGEAERESDSKQRPLSVIKLRSYFVDV